MLTILFSGRRWVTTLGAFILAIAPGWFGVLVAIQVAHGASDLDRDTMAGEPTEPFTADVPHRRDRLGARSAAASCRRTRARDRAASRAEAVGRGGGRLPVPQALDLRLVSWPGCGSSRPLVGLGLYYWWYHSIDKTPPVFVVLVYVSSARSAACSPRWCRTGRWCRRWPIAVMSAPLAPRPLRPCCTAFTSVNGLSRCLVGVIPY